MKYKGSKIKFLITFLLLGIFIFPITANAEPITITYDVDGGSEVSATVIEEGTRIGALPTTTKVGYALEGWYLDSEFNTRVSESTIATTNTELHAKWVVNSFPTVFKQDEATFDGTNILRTGIRLYNTTNWEKDYEIGFTITEYVPSVQTETQATFMNTKYEVESLNWPGLVVRRTSKTSSNPERLSISQTINGTKQEALQTNITVPIQVKILRIDKKVYYEYKGGTRTLLQDMSSFNQQFDTEVTFGASLDENNEIMRPFIGKISNMYIKMGKYQNNTLTNLQVENETVTPAFNNYIFDYKTIVDKDTESVNVIATPGTDVIDVTNDGVHELHSGKNQIDIITTSSNGSIGVYTLEVLRNTTIPIDADCLDVTYNKSEQTLIPDSTLYDWVGGSNKQTNAGTYTLTARLKPGNAWSDGSTSDKTVTCSMNKLTPVITLDKEINELKNGAYDTFNEKASENGKFSSIVSTKGIVGILHDNTQEVQANTNNKVTIAGAKAGTTTVTIVFTPTDTNNMEIAEKSFDVTVLGDSTPDPDAEYDFITPYEEVVGEYSCLDSPNNRNKPSPGYATFVAPEDAYYKFELWGAQGGYGQRDGSARSGGKGSYVKAVRYLHEGDTFYVYVGCKGNDADKNGYGYGNTEAAIINGTKTCDGTASGNTCDKRYRTGAAGGYNGGVKGGNDTNSSSDYDTGGGGGGATDIRLVSGDFADFESVKSRVMVAGGGAGGSYDGTHGGRGFENNTSSSGRLLWGQIGYNATSGSGGGGGGYFGGKSEQWDGGVGWGGTSYVSGAEGVNSVSADSTFSNIYFTGSNVHYSGIKFDDIAVTPNNRTGNGYAKISKSGLSYDATLKRLSVNGLYTDERLVTQSGDQRIFNVTLNKYEVEATIDAEANQITSSVSWPKKIKNPVGDSSRLITVTAQDGSVEIYQIFIHRDPNDIDYLKDLTFNGQTVPGFDPDVLEYTVEIDPYDETTPNFEIGATKYSDEQTVTGLGSYTTRNGARDYPVTVTSEDGTKTRTYIIHTHKPHTTKLKELELRNVEINPTFDKNVFEYNADIDPEDTYVNISKMIPWDSDATVVASGYSFIPTNRNGVVTITVTAPECEDTVYRITIKRQNLPSDVKITTPEREYIVPFESEFNLGTNTKGKKGKSYTVTFNYQDDRENTTGTYSDGYNPNGWLIKGVHYDDNATIIAIEDTVVSYDYSITGERIVLPEPEADDRTFSHWNSKSDGTGTHYTNESINNLSKNTTVYAIWDYEDVTIEFDSHGGSSVDSFTRKYKQEYGKLPTPTKEGYFFGGWFKENTYHNKVSAKTKATENITLHAQWIETDFPYVYPFHDTQYNCYGSVYIDTGIELYSQENWDKDYEIGFTIDEYNYSDQVKQATIVSDKYEVESLDFPGMAFRRSNDDFSKLEITQNQNGNKAAIPLSYTLPLKVRIVRIDKVVYYSINDGELTLLQDMSNFNQQHDIPVYFCAADDGNGGVQRLAKAKISNYYIKAGDYYEENQEHSVTYPDGTVKMYPHNTLLQLESNTGTKDDEVLSTVTFKYHNGEEDTTSDVLKKYIPNGFDINSIHYDDEATLVVNEDKVIENSFDIEVVGAEFPEDPVKENYEFVGWFTEEAGGTKKTSYSGLSDITLHAQYTNETVTVTTPEGEDEVPKGSEYTLGTNDITKESETYDVTFKFHNGEADIIKQVERQFIPNGWKVNGTWYPDGGKFVVEEDTEVVPDYIEIMVPVEFPLDPEREGYDFQGWFDSVTGGHEVTAYDRDEPFVLHAQWELKILDVTTPEGTEEVPYGTDYTLGTNNIPKDSETYNVTFKYHDGVTDDVVKQLTKDFTPNGWLVNGVHYANGATFTVIEDVVIEPDYRESTTPVEFPEEPTRDEYIFVGWFTEETGGGNVDSYSEAEDITLHAHWTQGYPEDISIDAENVTMFVGETHPIVVTFVPEGTEDVVTYTNYDENIISVTNDGIITGLEAGTTTITVSLKNVPDVTKTINVTVIGDKLASDIYEVRDSEYEGTDYRIVIGAEIEKTISEFKDNMTNPNEYIKIYDTEGNELEEDDIIKTRLVIKLEYNGMVLDEAYVVLRGDVDGDGYVNVSDYITVLNVTLENDFFDDYIEFAAADVEEDEIINVSDYIKIMDYNLENIDSLND